MVEKYILKYFLGAKHYVIFNGNRSPIHPHNWQLELLIKFNDSAMIDYREVDKAMERILEKLEDTILNDLIEFQNVEATTENIGRFLFKVMSIELEKLNCILEAFKISENAARTFLIQGE